MFKKREQKGAVRRKREVESSEEPAGKAPKVAGFADSEEVGGGDEAVVSAVVRDGIGGRPVKATNAFSTGTGERKAVQLAAMMAEQSEGAAKHEYGGSATAQNEVSPYPTKPPPTPALDFANPLVQLFVSQFEQNCLSLFVN